MAGTTLVTGATGTLGRQLVPRLVAAGRDVRALSRRAHAAEEARVEWVVGNMRGGTGQERAVTGVDAIVHCATSQRGDLDAARQLLRAAARAGSPHLVYVSIVGIDRVPVGYYRTKLAVERLVADSGLPFTILRATQFHDLILTMFSTQRRLPALLVPARTSVQPVDAGEVADRLTELVAGGPARRVADFGGPEIRDSGDLARRYLRAFGRRRAVLSVPVPGKIGRALRDGGQLAPAHAAGQLTFDQFVATRT